MQHDNYNYRDFKVDYYTLDEFPGPKPGEKMIDVPFLDLEGNVVQLNQFLDKPLVVETGSLSCPLYTSCIEGMNELSKRRSDVNFVLVYVREAHPGERTSNHTTLRQKIKAASKLKRIYGETRKVLIDSLDGKFHKTYGTYPNSIYVINTDRVVVFRGVWNHIQLVEEALESLKNNEVLPEKNLRPSMRLGWLTFKTLFQGGIKAFWDIVLSFSDIKEFHKKANTQRQ